MNWKLVLRHISINDVQATDTTFTVEDMYQAFKERLRREMEITERQDVDCPSCGNSRPRGYGCRMSGCPVGPAR